jgi:hypothetical protein
VGILAARIGGGSDGTRPILVEEWELASFSGIFSDREKRY